MKQVFIPQVLSAAVLGSPGVFRQVHTLRGATMGTGWSVRFAAEAACRLPDVRDGIQRVLDDIVGQMSTWLPESDLNRFNNAASQTWHDVPENFFEVLQCALNVAQDTYGAYDPTVGPLVNLWGFGPRASGYAIPTQDAIDAARGRCNWRRIEVDRARRRAWQPGGACVDFSSIAKGFGVDRVSTYLMDRGIRNHLVEIGGELLGQGLKPDGMPWWIELEQPLQDSGANQPSLCARQSIVALHGMAVATSGDYRRYFDVGGVRYGHTIDPRNGYPVRHGLASVTVLHPVCMVADALATALTVLGLRDGMDYAKRRGVAARFMVRHDEHDRVCGFEEHITPALAAMLE